MRSDPVVLFVFLFSQLPEQSFWLKLPGREGGMAGWSNSRRHDATDAHHASQDVWGILYVLRRSGNIAWVEIRLCPSSPISDITSASGKSAPRGAPIRTSAVRHAALGGRSYIRRGGGVHQDLKKLEF